MTTDSSWQVHVVGALSSASLGQSSGQGCRSCETDTMNPGRRPKVLQCIEFSRPCSERPELPPSGSKRFELYDVIVT